MKKTFPLTLAGRHPDRVRDALKHEIRQYLRRERRKPLLGGVDFLDFDCRFGLTEDNAAITTVQELAHQIDTAAAQGATHVYVEILAKPGHRAPRPATTDTEAAEATGEPSPPPPAQLSAQDNE